MKFLALAASLFIFDSYGFEVKLIHFSGDVKLVKNEESRSVEKNQKIGEDEEIKTGDDSLAILSIDKHSTVRVEENTQIQIKKILGNQDKESETSIILSIGSVLVDVAHELLDGKLEVKTQTASFGVRGTKFLAAYEDEQTWLTVENGAVEAKSNLPEQIEMLTAGEGLVSEKKTGLTQVKKYDWARKINWKIEDHSGYKSGNFRKLRAERISEFKKKRQAWKKTKERQLKVEKFKRYWENKRKIKPLQQRQNPQKGLLQKKNRTKVDKNIKNFRKRRKK